MEDKLVIRYTERFLKETSTQLEVFACDLLIPALVQNGIDAHQKHEDYYRWRRATAMRIGRILNGAQRFPLAYKQAWVSALPNPYRSGLVSDLLATMGFACVPLPEPCIKGEPLPASLKELTDRFSDVLAVCIPAHDGVYDMCDIDDAEPYINALDALSAAAETEKLKVISATGVLGSKLSLRSV